MNCCNHNNNKHNKHNKHSHMGHMWMMLLCCGAPIIALAVISLLGSSLPGARNALAGIIPFICPVMMIAMIPMMLIRSKGKGREDGHCTENTADDAQENRLIK